MVPSPHRSVLVRSVSAAPVLALFVVCSGGCSDDSKPGSGTGGGEGGAAAGSGGQAAPTGGSSISTGGTLQATGGAPVTGGSPATGGTPNGGPTTGGATTGGAATGGTLASGGTSAGAAGGGAAGAPGGAAGGGGESLGGTSGAGGSGGAVAGGGSGGGPASKRSPGCGKTSERPNRRTQQTMQIAGATRYYLLDVPENDGQTPLALVFGLHGYDMNNVAVIDLYNFTSRSGGKAITVLPQGEGPPPGDVSHWGDNVLKSRWEGNAANYEFIEKLKTDIEERYCVDTTREFIAGFSMGGYFTNGLACAHPDWFRAFAPVAGGGPGQCSNADAKPPIMITHGTADDIVALSNGEGSRDFWRNRNGCSTSGKSSFMGCTTFDGCPEESPVIWCTGNWNHTISSQATANMWSFFNGFD